MKPLLLWGAGGHAKVVTDVLNAIVEYREFVFVDSNVRLIGNTFLGFRVYPPEAIPQLHQDGYDSFIMCIGHNLSRSRHFQELVALGFQPATAIHPTAVVSSSAFIGAGTVVMPQAVINASAQVGEDCIINTGAIVEHDCVVGDHVHISPGAALGGGVTLERLVHVGLNASILPGVSVGRSSIVGAGAVVVKRVPENVVVTGVPARVRRSLS